MTEMRTSTATDPWTATICWSPGQNAGAVSVLEGRAPLFAVMGSLAAGETPKAVAADYGAPMEAVHVLDHLREDIAESHRNEDDPDEHTAVLAFLAARVACRAPSCVGRSSNALVEWTLAGGVPPDTQMPRDGGDLARCHRTVDMAPPGLASRMRPVVDRWERMLREEKQ